MKALLAALAALAILAPQAHAHARLERTVPADGAHLQAAPQSVAFFYNESIEASFGAIRVFDAQGNEVETGSAYRPQGSDRGLAINLRPNLPDGTYTATFRIISADSHPVSGAVSFAVGNAGAGAPVRAVAAPPQPSAGPVTKLGFWLDRFAGYVAIALALGVPFFLAWAWWPALAREAGGGDEWLAGTDAFDRRVRVLVGGGIALGAVASLLALPLQAASAGGTSFWSALNSTALNEVLDTRFGTLIALRTGAWVLLGVLVAVIAGRGRMRALRPASLGATGTAVRRPVSPDLAVLGMLPVGSLLVSPALAGHARTQSPAGLLMPADVIHVAAMSLWLGGLAALVFALPAALAPLGASDRTRLALGALSRFSPSALAAVIALALTGTIAAIFEVGRFGALLDSGYGRAVLAKIVLLVVLIGLGAANRQRLLPALRRGVEAGVEPGRVSGWFRRTLRVEVALIAVVLGVTAVLVAYATAQESDVTVKPAAAASVRGNPVAGSTPVGPVVLRYTVDPGVVGKNDINLFVRNPEGGASSKAKEVQVALSLPSRGIGPLKPDVVEVSPGHYEASASEFNLPGTWSVAVTVRTSDFDEAVAKFQVRVG